MLGSGRPILSGIHHSAGKPGLGSIDIDEILTAAPVRNARREITGMLLMENGRFL